MIFIYPKDNIIVSDLLIRYRIEVKLLNLTFKALDDLGQSTSSHNSLQSLVSDSCGGGFAPLAVHVLRKSARRLAFVWDGFMGKKAARWRVRQGRGSLLSLLGQNL